MIKEFKIVEILNAVDNLSKIEKKKTKIKEIKDYSYYNRALIPNKKAESNIGEILVLDQMIE